MEGLTFTVVVSFLACLLSSAVGHSSLFFEKEQNLQQVNAADPKVWLFAVDGLKRPYSFIDAEGSLVGFDVDVINAVCKKAGKQCKMVLADFTECVFSQRGMTYPGRGLMAGWFDACPGFAITVDRAASFEFTDPYITTVATFTVAPGNPKKFDPSKEDYSGFTLCHLTGAYTNEACLTRLHKAFGKILIARDLPEAKAALLNGTAQALFSPRTRIEGLDVLGARLHCDQGGAGVMVKKGSLLPSWWNPAFSTIYASGEYTTICEDASQRFNYPIKCLPPPPALN
ncbi:L-arginine-binding protein-like [Littorina saxatilis]|uniref:Solute-binding protein family 3/N-terminal domain-containing protein n=1 Tax=Littorina saxatilis TaxID=31220 RepID=A0AAN9B8I5_9CAEN